MNGRKNSLPALKKYLILMAIARGAIFWYAIEKLFLLNIGVSLSGAVLAGVVGQGSKFLFELPTSVIADRWSRRNSLMVADTLMIICSIGLGLSASLSTYIPFVFIWAMSDALSSGVYEAFAYDALDSAGASKTYRKVYARMMSSELIAMALAGLAAGVISRYAGYRPSFFLVVIPMLLKIYVLAFKVKEPPIVRTTDEGLGWVKHIGGAVSVMNSRRLRWTIVIFIFLYGFQSVWFEYYQLIGVDVHISKLMFGSLIAVVTAGLALGAELTHRIVGSRVSVTAIWLVLILAHVLGLRLNNPVLALANIFINFVAFRMLLVYLQVYLQEHIGSERRATIMSLAASAAYIWFFALAAIFTITLRRYGIRPALMFTSLPFLFVGVLDILRGIPWAINKRAAEIEVTEGNDYL